MHSIGTAIIVVANYAFSAVMIIGSRYWDNTPMFVIGVMSLVFGPTIKTK